MKKQLNDYEMWELKSAFRYNDIALPRSGKWNLTEMFEFIPKKLRVGGRNIPSIECSYIDGMWYVHYGSTYSGEDVELITALKIVFIKMLNDKDNNDISTFF